MPHGIGHQPQVDRRGRRLGSRSVSSAQSEISCRKCREHAVRVWGAGRGLAAAFEFIWLGAQMETSASWQLRLLALGDGQMR